jgi:hypothetical protein
VGGPAAPNKKLKKKNRGPEMRESIKVQYINDLNRLLKKKKKKKRTNDFFSFRLMILVSDRMTDFFFFQIYPIAFPLDTHSSRAEQEQQCIS